MRRDFALPQEDVGFLESIGLPWETVLESNVKRVVICGYTVPNGYTQERVDINLRIENGYPDTQIDMMYFFPHLARSDGQPIGALTTDSFDGKVWQRWSRHRTAHSSWRPGEDCIETHLIFVQNSLKEEFKKR